MKKIFYGLFSLIVLIAIIIILLPKPVKVETIVLKKQNFRETLQYDGVIRSRSRQTIYAFATGSIENLKVKVGDMVKKGQVLSRLTWDYQLDIKSPLAGVVSKIFRDSAGPVNRGEALLEISNLSDLEIVIDMLTPDAVRLKINDSAQVLNWGGPGELSAHVVQISKAGAVKLSALGVEEERTEVKLVFNDNQSMTKAKFGDTYHVEVVLLVSEEQNVLAVPLGALFKSEGLWSVYRKQEGIAKIQSIEISKKNEKSAIVTSGLKVGDEVILFPSDKVSDGTKVAN